MTIKSLKNLPSTLKFLILHLLHFVTGNFFKYMKKYIFLAFCCFSLSFIACPYFNCVETYMIPVTHII